MSSIKEVNRSLLYLLILTIIGSAVAFHIVVSAYDGFLENYHVEQQ